MRAWPRKYRVQSTGAARARPFPHPLRYSTPLKQGATNALRRLWRSFEQTDRINKIGFPRTVGADQNIERTQFNANTLRAEGQ